MRYEMHLHVQPFYKVLNGEKILEVRLNDAKRQLLNVGDEILFINRANSEQTILKTIKAIRKYKTFKEMAVNEDCSLCGMDKGYNTQDVVNTYYTYYSEDEEKKFGVVVIELSKS